jgi:protein-tyrosine phosphatase
MGNICRSPLAEGIFGHIVAEAGLTDDFTIASAGTGGWHEGDPPDQRSIATAKSHGIDISGQRARRVRPRDFTDFDLILAMDRDNLAVLEKSAPHGANIHLSVISRWEPERISPIPIMAALKVSSWSTPGS